MLPAVWILGTAVSTAVVFAAVQMVSGSVVAGQREPLTSAAIASSTPLTPTMSLPGPSAGSRPSQSPTTAPAGPTPVLGPAPATSPGPPVQQPPSSTRTFALVGGTAQVSCGGDAVVLNWATPNSGFWVETSTDNGGATLEIRFRSNTHESRLEATCASGTLQSSVREESS